MKLRIKGDSLRLRLTRSEVTELAAKGRLEDSIHFGEGNAMRYAIVAQPTSEPMMACFDNGLIEVSIASEQIKAWAFSDQVGMTEEQSLGRGQTLRLLVEKDFACLKPRLGEDDSDAFLHPNSDDIRC